MNPYNRIIINALATYGRSVLGLFLGLFSARWLLSGLGEVDLGLFNVVGGMMPFVRILNGIVCAAVARYYAYVIGQGSAMQTPEESVELLRKWFSTAFFLHSCIPIVLVLIFYPIGMYAVHHWFVIPPERIIASEWVVRCAFISTFIAMASAPYIAMYSARQLITELALFGLLQTILYALSAYVLNFSKMDRLILFSVLSCSYLSITSIIQVVRAHCAFAACRLKISYMFNLKRIKALLSFSSWTLLSTIGLMMKEQGTAFMINGKFGVSVNAAFSLAGQVSNQTNALSSALEQALAPAITTAEGASKHDAAIALANRSCKFITLLLLIFCIPVVAEIQTLLRLWLVNPPEYTCEFCILVIISFAIDRLSAGYTMAINASGRIAVFQTVSGIIYLLTLPIFWGFAKLGCGPISVGFAFVSIYLLLTISRVFIGWHVLKMSITYWIKKILIPVLSVAVLAIFAAWFVVHTMPASLPRVGVTSVISALAVVVSSFIIAFDESERNYLINLLKSSTRKLSSIRRRP